MFTVDLKTINYLNLKYYYYFEGILQVLKFEFQKFRILEISETFTHGHDLSSAPLVCFCS